MKIIIRHMLIVHYEEEIPGHIVNTRNLEWFIMQGLQVEIRIIIQKLYIVYLTINFNDV